MRKQKLSPEASKAKAVRDKKIAMTEHRKKRKNENERMGQRPDSDIHHTKDGKQVRVSIKDNRGNFGNGTKNEGPSMMGQTWLNRRIKGPNAEGDPVKKKKGGVKPYITYDPNDPRIQAYSDSLSVHNQYEHMIQPDYKTTSTKWNSNNAKNEYKELNKKYNKYIDYEYEPLSKLQGKTYNKEAYAHAFEEQRNRGKEHEKDAVNIKKRMQYLTSAHRTTTSNQIKYKFDEPESSFNVKGMTPVSWDKTVVKGKSHYTGGYNVVNNKYGSVFGEKASNDSGSYSKKPDSVTYSPKFKKPTQRVILREKIEKMPIGKLKSKSTTPNKLGNRQTVMGTSGKREPASMYQKRKGLTDNQMYRTFPGLDPNKTK